MAMKKNDVDQGFIKLTATERAQRSIRQATNQPTRSAAQINIDREKQRVRRIQASRNAKLEVIRRRQRKRKIR